MSVPSAASSSTRVRPTAGPSAMAMATARLSDTIGDGDARQHAVQPGDVDPVRLLRRWRRGVDGGDRGLELVGPNASLGQRRSEALGAGGDLIAVPQAAVLIGEQDEIALGVEAGLAPGVVEQHERQETVDLGLIGDELAQHAAQADRFRAQIVADELVPCGGAVSLVEHQVQHVEHGIETLGALGRLRNGEGMPAARILRLARTSRWAMVASGTRKARRSRRS